MDVLCHRLENLVDKLSQTVRAGDQESTAPSHDNAHQDLVEAARVLRSMPQLRVSMHGQDAQTHQVPASYDEDAEFEDSSSDEVENLLSVPEPTGISNANDSGPGRAGALVRDSYGHLR